jgi:hypothetical protein
MGPSSSKAPPVSDGYVSYLDPNEYFDYSVKGSIVSEWDYYSSEVQSFLGWFKSIYPKPTTPEKELCESDEHYEKFLTSYNQVISDYDQWAFQCFVHIKKGFKVGIPYVKNAPKQENNKITPTPYNLPPVRYRHLENYDLQGSHYHLATYSIRAVIAELLGRWTSEDVANKYFDEVIRNSTYDSRVGSSIQELREKVTMKMVQLNQNQHVNVGINADQVGIDYPARAPAGSPIYKVWGKKGEMKKAFPTMWLKFRNNVYGDGTKTDPETWPILGFPRLHEDFINGGIFGFNTRKSQLPKPIDLIFSDTKEFKNRFDYKTIISNIMQPKTIIKPIVSWLQEDHRFQRMEVWLREVFPDMMPFYYIDPSQQNHHLEWKNVMGCLLYGFISSWIQDTTEPFKDQIIEKENTDVEVKSYSYSQVKRKRAFESKQMEDIKEAWKMSYESIFKLVATKEWTDFIPPNPSVEGLDPFKSTDEEFSKMVFNFMSLYPLPKPQAPGILNKSSWDNLIDLQWGAYLVWIETNINARGKPGYVLPGEIITINSKKQNVFNIAPNIVLKPFEGHEKLIQLWQIATPLWTLLFGDRPWTLIIDALKDTFELAIDALRKLYEHLPEIGLGLFLIGGVLLVGYGASQYIGEKAKEYAK